MIIRSAKKEDINEIFELAFNLHRQHSLYNEYYSLKDNAKSLIQQYYSKLIQSNEHYFIVAIENEKIIGYAYASIGKRAPYYKEVKFGFFDEIYIKEKYRKKGIGKNMIKSIMFWFKKQGFSYSELEVDAKNGVAISIWEKKGYHSFINKMLKKLT